ncbi:MAG: trehalose-phosphatase [Caldimonas sp.]
MTSAHLFSIEGMAALASTMSRGPLLAFDFDGTLAPIVARPDDARVPLAVARRLDRLAQRLPIAIISGRRVDDIRERLSFAPQFVIGNHGAEDPLAGSNFGPERLDPVRGQLRAQAAELESAGVTIEDKGYSLALHYRLSRERERARLVVEALVAGLGQEASAYGGKMVMNIVAAGADDKADAVAGLVRRCGVEAAVFLGDDVNDEPVFARAEPSWLTVKVGRDDPASKASFAIDATEVARLLDAMLDAVARADAAVGDRR